MSEASVDKRPGGAIGGGRGLACLIVGACLVPGFGQAADEDRPAEQDRPANQVLKAAQVVQAKPAQPAKEARPAEEAVDAQMQQQLKQQAAHWEQVFTKLLYGELELMRATCGDLSPKSRRAIAQAGEQLVKDSAMRLAEVQLGRRLGVPRAVPAGNRVAEQEAARDGDGAAGRAPPDPLTAIPTALADALAEHAGEKRAAAYSAEVAARTVRRRKAVVDEVVSMLDDELVLTTKQRETIAATLLDQWGDSLALATTGSYSVNGRRVLRGVPTKLLKPHLSELQKRRLTPDGVDVDPAAARQELTHVWINQQLANVQGVARDPWWFPRGEAAP